MERGLIRHPGMIEAPTTVNALDTNAGGVGRSNPAVIRPRPLALSSEDAKVLGTDPETVRRATAELEKAGAGVNDIASLREGTSAVIVDGVPPEITEFFFSRGISAETLYHCRVGW